MKRYIILIISIFFLFSCKTKKEVTEENPPPKNSYQTASLPKLEIEENKPFSEENDEMKSLAKEMANAYCKYVELAKKYSTTGANDENIPLKKAEEEFNNYKENLKEIFPTEQQQREFNKIFQDYIKSCNH